MVIVLEHANQPVQGGAGNKGSPDPVVELTAGQFVRVRAVGLNGPDFLAAHDLLVERGVAIGQQESLARLHPRFGGLDVAIELLGGFGLQLLRAEPGGKYQAKGNDQFHRETSD